MKFRPMLMVLCAAMMLVVSSVCSAEKVDFDGMDFAFVDARGETGYYVDMNSFDFKDDNEVTARVEMVRADIDRLYLYMIHFNRAKKSYQIMDSTVAEYASKEKVGGSSVPMKEQSYAPSSPMENVVNYIFHPEP
ncbi:MAG: hypothetical protein ACI4OA_06890 [Selenomonadaceae bacterium]